MVPQRPTIPVYPSAWSLVAVKRRKTFEVVAVDDDIDDDDETMTLTFGTLPHRVNAGNLTTAIVSLIDNDDPIVEISFDRATELRDN